MQPHMEAATPMMSSGPKMVLGVPIGNPQLADMAKKVLYTSALICVLSLLTALQSFKTSLLAGVVDVAFAVLIPACGYFSVKNNDQTLAMAFCGCNLFSVVKLIFFTVWVGVGVATIGAHQHGSTLVIFLVSVLICLLPSCVVSFLGFWWGNQFFQKLKEGHVVTAPPTFTTGKIQPQLTQPQQNQAADAGNAPVDLA